MHLQSLSLLYKGPYIQILWNRLWTSCGGEGRFSTYHRGLNLNLIFYLTCHNEAWLPRPVSSCVIIWHSLTLECGEGNGTPLQYSCLENPMDGGAWKAAVHGVTKSDMTERLHFHFSLSCIGEGNGNPLQCSCLENPRHRRAWWAAVYGVTQSQTRLKQLSSSSIISINNSELSM